MVPDDAAAHGLVSALRMERNREDDLEETGVVINC